jgi:predicted ATP-dependent protease
MITVLTPEDLRKLCPTGSMAFTEPLSASTDVPMFGQERAREALSLGLGLHAEGFNIYVSGEQGSGKLRAVESFISGIASTESIPGDQCYLHCFSDPYQPRFLKLPAGRAVGFRKDMKTLIKSAVHALVKAFEHEDYAERRQQLHSRFESQQAALQQQLMEEANREQFLLKQNTWEVFTVPTKNGQPLTDQEFAALPVVEQEDIRKRQDAFSARIQRVVLDTRHIEKEAAEAFAKLESEVAGYAITNLITDMEERYVDLPAVVGYLQEVKQDILENLAEFLLSQKPQPLPLTGDHIPQGNFLRRYEVNVLVDNSHLKGAPVVIERNPTYNNLAGKVEKETVMGTLVTDFTMIRKGSLHSANGGYLVIRAEELLRNPFSWDALKRAIRDGQAVIEEAADQLGYLTTRSLKPEPIPLNVKVVIIGSEFYHDILHAYDPDFRALFKVKAAFDTDVPRTEAYVAEFVSHLRRHADQAGIPKPDAAAIACILEHGSRLAGDRERLTSRIDSLTDLLQEAGHYARRTSSASLTRAHVNQAIEQRFHRSNLILEKIQKMITRGQIMIDVTGSREGQVNGLSVTDMGDVAFGRPIRITSSVNPGKAGIVAIEREAALSGPIHTKGVMILSGYIAETFFQEAGVSLSARLVFEQSYSEIEGDSASSTELYAILSNLADLPIRQGIAVTGSLNQKGAIQAIGGVNEKIEGYYDVCRQAGLDGSQGVMIPRSNMHDLMLREDVVEAVRAKQFHVWAIDHVTDGIELLTGMKAGSPTEEETVYFRVAETLDRFSEKLDTREEHIEHSNGQGHWVSDVVMGRSKKI